MTKDAVFNKTAWHIASKKFLSQTAMAVRDPHRVVRYHGRLGFTSQQRGLLDIGEAAADHVKERIGREMLTYGRRHNSQRKPRHEHSQIVLVRGYGRIEVYERPVQLTR